MKQASVVSESRLYRRLAVRVCFWTTLTLVGLALGHQWLVSRGTDGRRLQSIDFGEDTIFSLLQDDAIIAGRFNLAKLIESEAGASIINQIETPDGALPTPDGIFCSMNAFGDWIIVAPVENSPLVSDLFDSEEEEFMEELERLFKSYGNYDNFSHLIDDLRYSRLTHRDATIVMLKKERKMQAAYLTVIQDSMIFAASNFQLLQRTLDDIYYDTITPPTGNLATILDSPESKHDSWIVGSFAAQSPSPGANSGGGLGQEAQYLSLLSWYVRDCSMTIDANDKLVYRLTAGFVNAQMALEMKEMMETRIKEQLERDGPSAAQAVAPMPEIIIEDESRLTLRVSLAAEELVNVVENEFQDGPYRLSQ